jgi:hypothetical protein
VLSLRDLFARRSAQRLDEPGRSALPGVIGAREAEQHADAAAAIVRRHQVQLAVVVEAGSGDRVGIGADEIAYSWRMA